jgi:hypothetical protein
MRQLTLLAIPDCPLSTHARHVLDALAADGLLVWHEVSTGTPNVRAAFARDLAVLATCRGMQLMNIAFGGTLRQHLSGRQGEQHRRREGEFTRPRRSRDRRRSRPSGRARRSDRAPATDQPPTYRRSAA